MNYIAIDLGGTRIKIGIINHGCLIATKIINADAEQGLHARLNDIQFQIESLVQSTATQNIAGLGIAFPGLVDTDKNCVLSTSGKYEDAHLLDFEQWGNLAFGLPVKLENDARLACLGEWAYGAGAKTANMVMCTLGTGVGSSAIINNRILRGKHYQAGVLGGHFIIDYKNSTDLCSCGNTGCLESLASTQMIATKVKTHRLYKHSLLGQLPLIDFENIFECAGKGDELSVKLREDCLFAWGIGLINLIHAYDPEVVVIGGGIANAAHVLIPYFEEMVHRKAWTPWGKPQIKIAQHPDTAALLGVSSLFEKQKNLT